MACANRRPLGRSESPCVFQKGPRHQLSGQNNAQPCAPPPVSSLAGWPYSHKHVIQNFFFPPSAPLHRPHPLRLPLPSHLQILPSYCTKRMREGGQRAAALFCSGPGLARLEVSEENCFFLPLRTPHPHPPPPPAWRLRSSYLGSSLSATPLCIWNALVFFLVSALCLSPPKRVYTSRGGRVKFLAVC